VTLQLGILLSAKRYRRLLSVQTDSWRTAALTHERTSGVRLLLAPPTHLQMDAAGTRMAAATESGWREDVVEPIPRVFYNLLVRPVPAEARALRDLNGDQRVVLFNETNRWDRSMINGILAAIPETQSLVAPGEPFGLNPPGPGLCLVAPTRRSLRDGALLVETGMGGRIRYTDLHDGRTGTVVRKEWPQSLPLRVAPRHLQLEYLSGWPVGPEGPVEWRFYLHRGETGAWAVAGSVAKRDAIRIGSPRERCWPLAEALSLTFGAEGPALAGRLQAAALSVMEGVALFLPGIAHAALDFWLDQEGRPTLVDLAGRFRLDWLTRAGESRAYQRLWEHPVHFAQLLARTGVEKLHVDFGRSWGR